MQTALSDRSEPALQSGPGSGGRTRSSLGNSREAAPGSSPGIMKKSRGDFWGVLKVHVASSPLPNEETKAEGVRRQPSPTPTKSQVLPHSGTRITVTTSL